MDPPVGRAHQHETLALPPRAPRPRLLSWGRGSLLGSGPSLRPTPMPQGWPGLSFVANGGRRSPAPHSPPCGYRSTRPLRRHPPFGLERNHLFSLYAQAHLGTIMSSLLSRAHLIPLQGLAARLFSIRAGPMKQDVLMYIGATSPLIWYIRNIIPRGMWLPRRRSWPDRTGSEGCFSNFALKGFSEVAPGFVTLHTMPRCVTRRG